MNRPPRTSGFTLVEVLVAAGIIVILMVVLLSVTDQTQRLMKSTSSKVEQFQQARVAFEAMTRRLAEATLNTYWDYEYKNGVPSRYQRSAELRFVSGITNTLTKGPGENGRIRPGMGVFFNAPIGYVEDTAKVGSLELLINTTGYFVEIGTDEYTLPPFLVGVVPARKRFRLMELMQPSEDLRTYQYQGPTENEWFAPLVTAAVATRKAQVVAENVVALVVLPRLSKADELLWMKGSKTPPILAPLYSYDTRNSGVSDPILNPRNQLPPVVQVVMIAIDEPSAKKLEDNAGTSDPYLGLDYSKIFKNPAILEDNIATTAPNDGDLSTMEQVLTSKRASYRIFSSNVSIRGAKWSRSQVK